ncbi:MAG: hypothetical protein Q8904_13185 [Bacteroidota bacterium]|nr:hypothetical protein [Bacteroidota bacterium]
MTNKKTAVPAGFLWISIPKQEKGKEFIYICSSKINRSQAVPELAYATPATIHFGLPGKVNPEAGVSVI